MSGMSVTRPALEPITRAEAAALWHAAQDMQACVRALRDFDWATPDLIAAQEALLVTAKRALRKVQAQRRAAKGIAA